MADRWTGAAGEPVPTGLRHTARVTYTEGGGGIAIWTCDGCGASAFVPVGEEPDGAASALCPAAVARRLAELEAAVRAAKDRLDAAEARADAIEERVATADMPWRLPGCQCPADSKPADRCDSRWTRCNARLQYQRAVKANGGPS